MRRHLSHDDEGQIFPALVVVIAGLVAFTLFVIVPMGSAADRRAGARTAADAAALAALTATEDAVIPLEPDLADVLAGDRAAAADLVRKLERLPLFARVAAERYAARNGADVVDFDLAVDLAGPRPVLRSLARTRSVKNIEDTDVHASGFARAEVDVVRGLCAADGAWGVQLPDRSCVSLRDLSRRPPPPPPPPGAPTPSPTPTPEPFEIRFDEPRLVE